MLEYSVDDRTNRCLLDYLLRNGLNATLYTGSPRSMSRRGPN